ncbi:MAG TPA: glycosyltransferase [Candidatus Binatia bacterium]
MAAQPAISILLPARNAAATLDACWRSILRQREPDWECVLVDDGSEDDTLARARLHARDDARLVVVATPSRGIVAALEAGLARCRGALVARMDADDVMHRDRLRAQRTLLGARPELAAVGCRVRIFPRAGMRSGLRAYERWLNGIASPADLRAEAYVECPVAHPTLMIRRAVLADLGYRACPWPEDYDLVLRLLARGGDIAVLPRRLLAWRNDPSRLTWRDARYGLDRFTLCKAAFLAQGFLATSDRYVLWGYGETGRALRRALAEHGKRPSHIVELHAGRLGNVIHGAPVIHPEALVLARHRPLVASVAGPVPRDEIRRALAARGYCELRDFIVAA